MPSPAEAWLESLSPWPADGFGVGRIRELLDRLGSPQRAYPSIHVVGTNGKSTATRTVAALLEAEGLRTGAYTSPHASCWSERIQVEGADADLETVLGRVRRAAEAVGATQFEALTAAALAEFAVREVDAAVVEAGLGGRDDATNVLDAPVVLLTNVALEHADVLGDTREAIAREKLAVVRPGATAVLGEPEWEREARAQGAREVLTGGPREAASAFLGRPVDRDVEVALPGRLERRGEEVRDGAHTPEAAEWLVERLPRHDYVVCASILSDKAAEGILAVLARAGRALVATRSSNPRALSAEELARLAAPWFERVEAVADPIRALARARELAGTGGPVLVTGSLYLLADLSSCR